MFNWLIQNWSTIVNTVYTLSQNVFKLITGNSESVMIDEDIGQRPDAPEPREFPTDTAAAQLQNQRRLEQNWERDFEFATEPFDERSPAMQERLSAFDFEVPFSRETSSYSLGIGGEQAGLAFTLAAPETPFSQFLNFVTGESWDEQNDLVGVLGAVTQLFSGTLQNGYGTDWEIRRSTEKPQTRPKTPNPPQSPEVKGNAPYQNLNSLLKLLKTESEANPEAKAREIITEEMLRLKGGKPDPRWQLMDTLSLAQMWMRFIQNDIDEAKAISKQVEKEGIDKLSAKQREKISISRQGSNEFMLRLLNPPKDPHPAEQLLEVIASVLWEPADWFFSARDVIEKLQKGDYGGALLTTVLAATPFIPGAIGRVARKNNIVDGLLKSSDEFASIYANIEKISGIKPNELKDIVEGIIKLGEEAGVNPLTSIQNLEKYLRSFDEFNTPAAADAKKVAEDFITKLGKFAQSSKFENVDKTSLENLKKALDAIYSSGDITGTLGQFDEIEEFIKRVEAGNKVFFQQGADIVDYSAKEAFQLKYITTNSFERELKKAAEQISGLFGENPLDFKRIIQIKLKPISNAADKKWAENISEIAGNIQDNIQKVLDKNPGKIFVDKVIVQIPDASGRYSIVEFNIIISGKEVTVNPVTK